MFRVYVKYLEVDTGNAELHETRETVETYDAALAFAGLYRNRLTTMLECMIIQFPKGEDK